MDADSDLLLPLYRAARSQSTPEFQDFAIRLIEPRIRFSSAIWATGYRTGTPECPALVPILALSHTHRTDPAGVTQWREINRADKAIPIMLAHPYSTQHIHSPTLFAGAKDAAMRDYTRRFGRQCALVTGLGGPNSPLVEWSVLYRDEADDQFSAPEQARCQQAMLHLNEALQVNQIVQRAQGLPNIFEESSGRFAALVSPVGEVLASGDGFVQACRKEWKEFDTQRLPATAMRQLIDSGISIYRGRFLLLRARPLSDLWWLTATANLVTGQLSPRRTNVAALFVAGHSHKVIARSLGISPATVRNHLAASYRDLKVTNRAELKSALEKEALVCGRG